MAMTCPYDPDAARECMWDLAGQAINTAEFALILTVVLLSLSFFFCMIVIWMTIPRY